MSKARILSGRRAFLRSSLAAAGGAALLPWSARTARADVQGSPRFVFVLEGNCVEPIAMLSPTAEDAINSSLRAPIDGRRNWYRDYTHSDVLSVPTGDLASAKSLGDLGELASRASVLYGLSNKAGGGGHTPHHGTLSCRRTVGGSPGGETIDSLLARQLLEEYGAPFEAVRVGAGARALNLGTCATGRGAPAAILQQAQTAYDTFIGPVTGSDAAVRRGEMLRFAREDVRHTIDGSPAAASERQKLEDYFEALERMEAQTETLGGWSTNPAYLPAAPGDDSRYASSAHFDELGAQFAVATSALRLGLTNVAVVTSATSGEFARVSYPSMARAGIPSDRHNLHHQSGTAAAQDLIHAVSGRIVQEIATMARALEATPDGDGDTLLDNTVIVYLGDNGETHHSTASEFPVLTLGGDNLGFVGGRTLFYSPLNTPEHRRLSNLWMSLSAAAGFERSTFGGEDFTRFAGGALPGLLG